jgi:hypothetical protein
MVLSNRPKDLIKTEAKYLNDSLKNLYLRQSFDDTKLFSLSLKVKQNKLECFPLQNLMFVCKARTGAYTRWKVVLDLGEKQTL